jgi:hypothetical protein
LNKTSNRDPTIYFLVKQIVEQNVKSSKPVSLIIYTPPEK